MENETPSQLSLLPNRRHKKGFLGVKITFFLALFRIRTCATSVGAAGAPRVTPASPGASSPPTMATGWKESSGRRSRVSSRTPQVAFIWGLGAELGVLGWVWGFSVADGLGLV